MRIKGIGITQKYVFPSSEATRKPLPPPVSRRPAWFDGRFWDTAVYHRETLLPGMEGQGPALLTSGQSTVVIAPHYRFRIDGVGTLVATRLIKSEQSQLAEISEVGKR
jgi:N-methylhydantoinase A/oxoprolinase/acetone carboxylase beta subunit